ncbi:MAG TPA: hypothetical protein EYQ42_06130 [Thiotrichaceae bacterium]|jgi:hypothetical protein|nr:hypothetical protein [Thiotrichaceae bacterium]HIM08891.1 hypothetical protein [Gammaproteobacteria bacterium]
MNNRERLMDIVVEQKLERMDVAEMLKVKVAEVDGWLLSKEAKSHEEMPDMAIELLELKIAMKEKE